MSARHRWIPLALLLALLVAGAQPQEAQGLVVPVEKIAFDSCYMDYWFTGSVVCGITVVDADGSNPVTVAEGIQPAWSPDGSRMAFVGAGASGGEFNEVFVLNLGDGAVANLTNHPAFDWQPAWSPDGSKIAFVSNRDGPTELYLMRADGLGVTRLTYNVGFVGSPHWSPGSARIAFDCEVEGGNRDLCAINADGTGFVRLTNHPAADFTAAWSPDGARLAFATRRFGPYSEIAVMKPDGTGVTRLTYNVGNAGGPDWSPDGAKIAFTVGFVGACEDFCNDSIYVINADGMGLAGLARGSNPAWRPRGPGGSQTGNRMTQTREPG